MTDGPGICESAVDGSLVRGRERTRVARIAIADDDPASLELMRATLTRPDHEIREATSGAELVALLAREGPFDLVVTDVHMPWTEGVQVLASARAAHLDVPTIVVTGSAGAQLAAAVTRLGNARLLHKPFAISDLRAAVRDLLAWDL